MEPMEQLAITLQGIHYELSQVRQDINSFNYEYKEEIRRKRDREYSTTNVSQPQSAADHFSAVRLVVATLLRKHQANIPSYYYPEVNDVLSLYLMGSIGRYGVTQCMANLPSGFQMDNLTLVELLEEADKYLPTYGNKKADTGVR